jgi:hypothetical protein
MGHSLGEFTPTLISSPTASFKLPHARETIMFQQLNYDFIVECSVPRTEFCEQRRCFNSSATSTKEEKKKQKRKKRRR